MLTCRGQRGRAARRRGRGGRGRGQVVAVGRGGPLERGRAGGVVEAGEAGRRRARVAL